MIRSIGEQAWSKPEIADYASEEALKGLIVQSPGLLPGQEPLLLVTEFPVPGIGYLDLLGVSASGAITIVECKLRANPQIRREVVGQVLAYAGGLWRMELQSFLTSFERRFGTPLLKTLEEMAQQQSLVWDSGNVQELLRRNLKDGLFRLILVVDEITDELKTIVEYLSLHATIDVLALELGFVSDRGVEVLVPQTYGEEIEREKSNRPKMLSTEDGLFAALNAECNSAGVESFRRLYQHAKLKGTFWWGGGVTYPSVNAWYAIDGVDTWVWSCFAYPRAHYSTGPVVAFSFSGMTGRIAEPRLQRFAARLREIPGADVRLQGLEEAAFRRQPSLPIDSILAQADASEKVMSAIEELIGPTPA